MQQSGIFDKMFLFFYCLLDRGQLNAKANSFRSMRQINSLKTPLQAHFFRETDTLLKIRLKKLYFLGLSSFLYIAHVFPLWQAKYGHIGERLSSLYVYFPVLQWGHSFLRNICFILPRRSFLYSLFHFSYGCRQTYRRSETKRNCQTLLRLKISISLSYRCFPSL